MTHICCGAFWGINVILAGFFLVPAVQEAGPGGGAVMGGIMKRKFSQVMTITGLLAMLSGIALYSMRFSPQWALSPEGLVLLVGGLLALSALGMGVARQRPLAEKLALLAKEGRQAEMGPVAADMAKTARIMAWHVVALLLLMTAHRAASTINF
jgi:hypothetical protein